MGSLRPNLDDISIRGGMFLDYDVRILRPEPLSALIKLVWYSAAARVWTYSEPDPEGALPSDEKSLCRLAEVGVRKWRSILPEVEHFFIARNEKWFLDRDWIVIGNGNNRPAISPDVRLFVMQRDGYQCIYCGEDEGPFHCDHVIPVAQGGATDPENLACACIPCNLSKGAKTPEQWLQ